MAGRIYEDNLPAVLLDRISANMLCDAARFPLRDVTEADGVQERSFTVVDMAHDGDHWRAFNQVLRFLGLFDLLRGLLLVADLICRRPEVAGEFFGHLRIESLVNGGKDFLFHQLLDHEIGLNAELLGKLFHRETFGHGDFAINWRRGRGLIAPGNRHPQPALFLLHVAMAIACRWLGLMPPLFGGYRSRGFHAQRRSRMHGTRPRSAGRTSGALTRERGPTHHGLAGANWSAIDRLTWHWSARRATRHAGPRRRGRSLSGYRSGLLVLKPCD